MSDALLSAYSALEARMKMVDVIANNLANVETIGFKRDLSRLLESDQGFDVGTYVDLASGDFRLTGNALDVAIDGPGFFVIQTPEGARYTRNGSFGVSDEGELVTKDGMPLLGTAGGPIRVGQGGGDVAIREGGRVMVAGREVATLKVVKFNDVLPLQKEGLSRLRWTGPATGIQDVPSPRLLAGHVERSNVNGVDEMVHLMTAYREFEAVQRSLKTLISDMNGKLVQELGRLAG